MDNNKPLRGLVIGLLIALVFMAGCVPSGEPAEGFDPTILIFLALLVGLFYFVMIRPQRKRQKEHQQMTQELQKGDKVVTAGGIYGQVESISEDSIVIKVESGATMRVAKGSVALKQQR